MGEGKRMPAVTPGAVTASSTVAARTSRAPRMHVNPVLAGATEARQTTLSARLSDSAVAAVPTIVGANPHGIQSIESLSTATPMLEPPACPPMPGRPPPPPEPPDPPPAPP